MLVQVVGDEVPKRVLGGRVDVGGEQLLVLLPTVDANLERRGRGAHVLAVRGGGGSGVGERHARGLGTARAGRVVDPGHRALVGGSQGGGGQDTLLIQHLGARGSQLVVDTVGIAGRDVRGAAELAQTHRGHRVLPGDVAIHSLGNTTQTLHGDAALETLGVSGVVPEGEHGTRQEGTRGLWGRAAFEMIGLWF